MSTCLVAMVNTKSVKLSFKNHVSPDLLAGYLFGLLCSASAVASSFQQEILVSEQTRDPRKSS